MDYLFIYLVSINIIAFLIYTIDLFIYRRNNIGIVPYGLCPISSIIGGALGSIIAILAWDRYSFLKTTRTNMLWKVFLLTLLFIQGVIVFAIYGPQKYEFEMAFYGVWKDYKLAIIYLAVITVVTFIAFGLDKRKATRNEWRIPEKRLMALVILGGGIGAILGMFTFWHKIKSTTFTVGVPLIMLAQVVGVCYLSFSEKL